MSRARSAITTRPRIRRADLPPGSSLCDHCTGKCCRYFALPLPRTPRTWDDFDEIRWYLAHGRTVVYVEQGSWYVLVLGDCQYLTPDLRCAIYHDRPKVCREYTTDECEYDDDWTFEKVFETPEQVWEYAEAILPPRRPRPKAGPLVTTIGPPPRPRPDKPA